MNYRINIYPKVFEAGKLGKLFLRSDIQTFVIPKIKIIGMESYTVPHTEKYRIDEDGRYQYVSMKEEGDGLFSFEYDFKCEQRYCVYLSFGDEPAVRDHVYAVESDLFQLNAYKGDTHLHTNRSDGEGDPHYVGSNYRRAGFDFIAITDHHKYAPSLEGRDLFCGLTSDFTVFPGEEVHNKSMGYFHIVNFGGSLSVNRVMEDDDEYLEGEIQKILDTYKFTDGVNDKRAYAYRLFISRRIRECGGVAILPHVFWECYGEYNAEWRDVAGLLRDGAFDALELVAGNDLTGHGDNLTVALWTDLLRDGVDVSVVGASDSHSTTRDDSLFNKHFSIVFADSVAHVPDAIRSGCSVAVNRRTDSDFDVYGRFRLVKYARFLLEEYFPRYYKLTEKQGELLMGALEKDLTTEIRKSEEDIAAFKSLFFAR